MGYAKEARAWIESGDEVNEENIKFWCYRISQKLRSAPDGSTESRDLLEALDVLHGELSVGVIDTA